MKRVGWFVLVAVELCAVAAALWWRFADERAQPAKAGDPARALPAAAASEDAPVAGQESALAQSQDSPPPVESEDYGAQFRAASDYLEFARSLLTAAREGDHAAQFYIFRAFEHCADDYGLYFRRRGVNRSLDDALKSAASESWPFDPEVVRRTYARCHTIMETGAAELGERDTWLRLASDGAYPVAQVIDAQKQFRELVRTNGDDPTKREKRLSQVANALRSRDPEVIWELGDTVHGIGLEPEGDDPGWDNLAWNLAACLRGFDCSPQSEAVRMMCIYDRACQPYETVADLIRRATQNDFPALETRARWINEKIDAGDWKALGF